MSEPLTEQELRVQALNCSVGHRLATESAAMVVENAEAYFAFLKDEQAAA